MVLQNGAEKTVPRTLRKARGCKEWKKLKRKPGLVKFKRESPLMSLFLHYVQGTQLKFSHTNLN